MVVLVFGAGAISVAAGRLHHRLLERVARRELHSLWRGSPQIHPVPRLAAGAPTLPIIHPRLGII